MNCHQQFLFEVINKVCSPFIVKRNTKKHHIWKNLKKRTRTTLFPNTSNKYKQHINLSFLFFVCVFFVLIVLLFLLVFFMLSASTSYLHSQQSCE